MANISYQPSLDLTEFPLEKIHDPRDTKVTRTQLLARHATMNFLFSSLYEKIFNRRLHLEHSLGDGFYFVDSESKKISEEQIQLLISKLHEILKNPDPIVLDTMPRNDIIKLFKEKGYKDKLGVIKAWQDANIPVIKCGDMFDYVLEPMSTEKSVLDIFEIHAYDDGILLRLPTMLSPTEIKEWKDPTVIHNMFNEYDEWARLIHCENVSKLNQAIFTNEIKTVRMVAEGLHERKIALIAEHLCQHFNEKRVITIAGPSSSNKTTFAKRLDIQLRVNGFSSTIIEMDDYFQDGDKIPFGPDGLQDLEHISAMNVELLAERVHKLLAGEPVPVRKYNFKRSKGEDDPKRRIFLEPGSFLIMEGIHGLNPELLTHIGTTFVTPIYVSALTPINIDMNHRFATSDLRLIRRIIRDNQFRGVSARKTLRRWTSVRVGEERNIFPYQSNAELFFNSSLVYELPILSVPARVLLSEATMPADDEDPTTEEAKDITEEARRLLALIDLCYPLSSESVPTNSCIREFIGGSELKY